MWLQLRSGTGNKSTFKYLAVSACGAAYAVVYEISLTLTTWLSLRVVAAYAVVQEISLPLTTWLSLYVVAAYAVVHEISVYGVLEFYFISGIGYMYTP